MERIMKLYIALNPKSEPLGVLLATSKDKAGIAFEILNPETSYVEEIDPQTVETLNGVLYVMTSTPIINSKYRKWKRGKP
jgi:hypothetical protein